MGELLSNIKFKGIKVTNINVEQKPPKAEYGNYVKKLKQECPQNLNILQVKQLLEKGNLMLWGTYADGTKDYSSFNGYLGTDFIVLDVDNKEELINNLPITTLEKVIDDFKKEFNALPLLYYYSFSDKGTHSKFRVVYKLDGFLNHSKVKYRNTSESIYRIILEQITSKYKYIDNACNNPTQVYWGTNTIVKVIQNFRPIKLEQLREIYKSAIKEDKKEQEEKALKERIRQEELKKYAERQTGEKTDRIDFNKKREIIQYIKNEVDILTVIKDLGFQVKETKREIRIENPWGHTDSCTYKNGQVMDWSNGKVNRDLFDFLQVKISNDLLVCINYMVSKYNIKLKDEFYFHKRRSSTPVWGLVKGVNLCKN